jgi:ribosomal protein S18 acetylase RimI-like enzyme
MRKNLAGETMQTEAQVNIRIRQMKESDIVALERVVHEAYRGGQADVAWKNEHDIVSGPRITQDGLRELLYCNDSIVLVAERGADSANGLSSPELCGSVLVERDLEFEAEKIPESETYRSIDSKICSTVVIGMLAVSPTAQNIGLGRLLVTAAEKLAKERFGATRAHMHVASVRDELMQWYDRLGYSQTGVVKPFPGPEAGIQALKENLQFVVIEKRL